MIGQNDWTLPIERMRPVPGLRRLFLHRATGIAIAIALTVGPPLLLPKPSQRGVWLEASALPFVAATPILPHRER